MKRWDKQSNKAMSSEVDNEWEIAGQIVHSMKVLIKEAGRHLGCERY